MGRGSGDRGFGPVRFAATVVASAVAVVIVAILQHHFVLGVELQARIFVFPTAVGVTFGGLLALVRRARAREREAREHLAARDEEITRLNRDLEDRVRARTAEVEQKTEALLRAQKTEVLGLLAGGVAHDFNNILTAVVGCSSALRDDLARLGPAEREAFGGVLDELDESAERARRLAHQLLTLGRSGTSRPETFDLSTLVQQLGAMLRRLLGERIALCAVPASGPCPVRADRAQVEQLVLNLAVNARDAMPAGGKLTIAVERAGPEVFLVVVDDGAGMDAETKARMFEPFFTTKGQGRGTGLGLMVVQEVARRWAARIDVESQPGRGTRVCVTFAASDEPTRAASDRAGAPAPAARPLTVLLVEDDDGVRRRLVAALSSAGHTVIPASEAGAAERLARQRHGEIDVIVSDVVLPGESGPNLVARLARLGLAAPAIFMSGYSPEAAERAGTLAGATVLQKPFAPGVLLARLAELAAHRRTG